VSPSLGGLSLLGDPWLDVALVLLVGLVAGGINSMAGGGSFLMIPMLVALGLPTGVANGTIRVAVLAQSGAAVTTFHRKGVREHRLSAKLAGPMILGAFAGSLLATRIDDAIFRPLIGGLLLAWAVVLVVRPGSALGGQAEEAREVRAPSPATYGLAALVGVYGGFLQAGVGFPILALLTAHLGYDLVRSNAVKVGLILAYTAIASLPVFALAGQIAWIPAGVLALGSIVGASLGARWQVDKGAGAVRWVVIVMVTVAGIWMLRPLIGL
jgi:uncharacterized membrane protein YfcA